MNEQGMNEEQSNFASNFRNRLTASWEKRSGNSLRRVGGEVTQRIANPRIFLAKAIGYHRKVRRTKAEQAVNLLTEFRAPFRRGGTHGGRG